MNRTYCLLLALALSYPALADTLTGKVVKVTDGDTVHVLQDNHIKEKIRLAGIDAPERKEPPGKKATRYLASLIGNKLVTVEYNIGDCYDRIVGNIQSRCLFKGGIPC